MIKTVSLETAKQLKEAGYPQGYEYALLNYYKNDAGEEITSRGYTDMELFLGGSNWEKICAAPTAEDILDQLPVVIDTKDPRGAFELVITKHHQKQNQYGVLYTKPFLGNLHTDDQHFTLEERQYNESLAESAAKMYLYLKKEELI